MFDYYENKKIDFDKLPCLTRDILRDYLIPKHPAVDPACLLNVLNVLLARVVQFNRVKTYDAPHYPIANYYAINFQPTGTEKDKPYKALNEEIFRDFIEFYESKSKEAKEKMEFEIKREAVMKYSDLKLEKERQKYIVEETDKIRDMRPFHSSGSPQALAKDCQTYHNAQFGSLFIKINEIASFLDSQNSMNQDFLSLLLDLYDGDINLPSYVNEKKYYKLDKIPTNLLFYGTPSQIYEGGIAQKNFKKILSHGFLRRIFISCMDYVSMPEDFSKEEEINKQCTQKSYSLRRRVNEIYKKCPLNTVFNFTLESRKIHADYKTKMAKLYNSLLKTKNELILDEIRGRQYKVMKLSTIIACCEHPEEAIIKVEDVEYAIYQTEMLSASLEIFFDKLNELPTEKLAQFFIDNLNSEFNPTNLQRLNLIPKDKPKDWLKNNIELVEQFIIDKGYRLQVKEGYNKRGSIFKCVNYVDYGDI